jgi:hypothetical protein
MFNEGSIYESVSIIYLGRQVVVRDHGIIITRVHYSLQGQGIKQNQGLSYEESAIPWDRQL